MTARAELPNDGAPERKGAPSPSGSGAAADDHLWERGWDGHERAQIRRLARLSFAEKLAWLEEAHRLVQVIEAARRAPRAPSPAGPDTPTR